jgi:hypothetical protein
LEEELCDGGRLREASLLHLDHLLPLRSQDHHGATAGHDLVDELTEDETFPRSSTTPEHGDGMGRPEEQTQGFSLIGIESGIEWGSRSDEGMEGADTVASEADDVLLPVEDLGLGYGTRGVGMSQVSSGSAGEGLQLTVEELGFTDTTSETQALATTAEPATCDGLTLGIIVPDRQMLGEVRAGVSEAVLGLSREH